MPAYKGVEVWIEDSEHLKINPQDVTTNIVEPDDHTMMVKIEMLRGECYTVHCQSPVSVLCDVFTITASRVRKSAARFYLHKSAAVAKASGSSMGHTIEKFRGIGLRTPKKQFQQGRLGTVEVEIRRIGEIIEEGSAKGAAVDFTMIDEPNQPPWLVFRFEFTVKGFVAAPASTAKHTTYVPRRMLMKQRKVMGPSNEAPRGMGHQHLCSPRKHPREHDSDDGSSGVIDTNANLDLLQQEYQREQEEEQRLMQKLQEQLQAKRAKNVKLRRLLGETE